jgi:hypothetical protein
MPITNLSHIARSEGDPRVERKGPSTRNSADQLAYALGWFSIGLGIAELVAPGQIARSLGLHGKEGLIRAYGARELMSAVPTLSIDKSTGLARGSSATRSISRRLRKHSTATTRSAAMPFSPPRSSWVSRCSTLSPMPA